MSGPHADLPVGPATDTTAYDRAVSPQLQREAEDWPVYMRHEPIPGSRRPYITLRCEACHAFVLALTDRAGVPYAGIGPDQVTPAKLAHIIRSHGRRLNERVSRETQRP